MKNGTYEYNISTVEFANAVNPSEKYIHHIHQSARLGGHYAELMRGFDKALKICIDKIKNFKR